MVDGIGPGFTEPDKRSRRSRHCAEHNGGWQYVPITAKASNGFFVTAYVYVEPNSFIPPRSL